VLYQGAGMNFASLLAEIHIRAALKRACEFQARFQYMKGGNRE